MPDTSHASAIRRFISAARRATLATVGPTGRPRLVPICFVLQERSGADLPAHLARPSNTTADGRPLVLYSAIDEKPKRAPDPLRLARVRDILARPEAIVLVDRWDERWERLAWARLHCHAELLGPSEGDPRERDGAIAALRAKYPQYGTQRIEARPLIRLTCEVTAAWGDLAEEES